MYRQQNARQCRHLLVDKKSTEREEKLKYLGKAEARIALRKKLRAD